MKENFLALVSFFKGKIPDSQLESDIDIYKHSDPTIALECLCSQISDHDISINRDIFNELKNLCESKGVDASYLADIQGQIKD